MIPWFYFPVLLSGTHRKVFLGGAWGLHHSTRGLGDCLSYMWENRGAWCCAGCGEVYVMEKLCVTAVVTLLWAEAVAGASRARHSLVSFVWSDLFQQSHSPGDLCVGENPQLSPQPTPQMWPDQTPAPSSSPVPCPLLTRLLLKGAELGFGLFLFIIVLFPTCGDLIKQSAVPREVCECELSVSIHPSLGQHIPLHPLPKAEPRCCGWKKPRPTFPPAVGFFGGNDHSKLHLAQGR